jgi:serine/threonine protein kinase
MAQQYGKWVVVRQLGEGGQSHTFVVQEKGNEAAGEFVLKRLKNLKRIERFRSEIEAGLKLAHANLIRVVDSDIEYERPYFVTEFCTGGHLTKSAMSKMSIPDRLRLFQAICRGVGHAHAQKVTHRDLKPENIFLRADGTPVVGDFGLCFLEDGQRFTVVDEAVGPHQYIAPELEDGRAESVGPASDVYSLGKLLYWMLTGRVFAREKHRDPTFDVTKGNDTRSYHFVNELLDRMIVAQPDARFKDANAVADAVEDVLHRIESNAHVIDITVPQHCIYCGKGSYEVTDFAKFFGTSVLRPGGFQTQDDISPILVCNYCGNVQMFRPDMGKNKDAWQRK